MGKRKPRGQHRAGESQRARGLTGYVKREKCISNAAIRDGLDDYMYKDDVAMSEDDNEEHHDEGYEEFHSADEEQQYGGEEDEATQRPRTPLTM